MEKFNSNNNKGKEKSASDQKSKSKIQNKINKIETGNESKLHKDVGSFVKIAKKQAAAGVYPKEAIDKAMEYINDSSFDKRADLCLEIIAIQNKYNKDSSKIFDYLEKLPRMDKDSVTKAYLYGKVAKIKAEYKLDPSEQIERGLAAINNIEIPEPSWGEKHAREMVQKNGGFDPHNSKMADDFKIRRQNRYHSYRCYAYIGIAEAQKQANLDYSEVLKKAINEAKSIRQDIGNYDNLMSEIKKIDNDPQN